MLSFFFGLACQPTLPVEEIPESGKLTFLFSNADQTEATEIFRKLHDKYPESQVIFVDETFLERGINSSLPDLIPDVAFVEAPKNAEIFFPPTGRSIDVPGINVGSIVEQFPEIENELSVPQRKKRMALLTQSASNDVFEPALRFYVAAQMRWTEENLSLHPAIQLAYGGGVHTNVMLDKHVKNEDWEVLLQDAAPWPCRLRSGGGSAFFYACQIPAYSSSCLAKSSSLLSVIKSAASTLKKVSLPAELKTSRTEESQTKLDEILLSRLQFSSEKTICTSSGCYSCTTECLPTSVQSVYQPLSPHDAAWRFCTHGEFGSGSSYCAQLRFDEDDTGPIISLHGDPCAEKNPVP